MAYDSTEAIHKLNIGIPEHNANGLEQSLQQGSVQGYVGNNKKVNVDPSMNSNAPIEVNGAKSSTNQSSVNKADYKKPEVFDKANRDMANYYSSMLHAGFNIDFSKFPNLR